MSFTDQNEILFAQIAEEVKRKQVIIKNGANAAQRGIVKHTTGKILQRNLSIVRRIEHNWLYTIETIVSGLDKRSYWRIVANK